MTGDTLYSFSFQAMGTECHLHLYAGGAQAAENAYEAAADEVGRLEGKYSRFRGDSVLADINRAAASGGAIALDGETAGLISYALACHGKSGGLFDVTSGVLRQAWDFQSNRLPAPDVLASLLLRVGLHKLRWEPPILSFPTVGMELDFGGLVKEYAADQAAGRCADLGITAGLINLGGDIQVLGPHPDGNPWRIQIRHPRHAEAILATVTLRRGALATSGDYERFMEIEGQRYCHLLDPATGWPVGGLASVSVVAGQCLVAGSISTIAMLKGEAGIAWLRDTGLDHLWMDAQGGQGGTLPVTAGR